MDRSYILIELYHKQYRQQKNDKQEDFYIQLDKTVILDQIMLEKQISYIKGALIIMLKNLEEQAVGQGETIQILVLINNIVVFRLTRERFKFKNKDKL